MTEIADKTFADCHKNAKFAKVFSLESFRLYGRSIHKKIKLPHNNSTQFINTTKAESIYTHQLTSLLNCVPLLLVQLRSLACVFTAITEPLFTDSPLNPPLLRLTSQ